MKIFANMLKGMVSTDSIQTALISAEKEYQETTKPMIETVVVTLKGVTYKGEVGKMFSEVMGQIDRRTDPIATLERAMNSYEEKLRAIQGLIEKELGRTVNESTATFRSVNITEYAKAFLFVSNYTRTLLSIVLMELTDSPGLKEKALKTDIEWLNSRKLAYKNTLRNLSEPLDKQIDKLKKIPSVEITDTETLANIGIKKSEVDPLNMGLLPVSLNPFWHLGRTIVEFQNKRYKLAIQEKALFEQQVEKLKLDRAGKKDAKLEQAITYFEGKVEERRYDVSRYEERYDI